MEPWAEDILGKIEVEVQGKGKFNLLEQLRKGKQAQFPGKQFHSPPEKPPGKRKLVVVGFEDEIEHWMDYVDLIVKTYTPVNGKTRIEIFCSGLRRKTVWFQGKEILKYPGCPAEEIKGPTEAIPRIGTVIFDF